MEITPEFLHKRAAELRHSRFVTHVCEECDSKISYIFNGEEVHYDNGCRCENGGGLTTKSSWKTVAAEVKMLLLIESKKKEVIEFWKL